MSEHKAVIVPESLRHNEISGGVQFVIRCCDTFEHSVHIMDFSHYASHEERERVIEDLIAEHEQRHAAHAAAVDFLKNYTSGTTNVTDCGCK